MRMRALLPLLVMAACTHQPAQAPAYTPVATPEPPTTCPSERAAADSAREEALVQADVSSGDAAAKAVFDLAECERRALDRMRIRPDEAGNFLDEPRAQFETAMNLYTEVTNYQVPRWVVIGNVRLGDLYLDWADKVRAIPPPESMTDPTDRMSWIGELDEAAGALEPKAAAAYRKALSAVEAFPDVTSDEVASDDIREACAELRRLDPGGETPKACAPPRSVP